MVNKLFSLLFLISSTFSIHSQNIQPLALELLNLNPKKSFILDSSSKYNFFDKGNEVSTSVFHVSKSKDSFSSIITAEVLSATKSHYDIQANWASAGPIEKGDVVLARFTIRSIYAKQESGDAIVYFFVQQATGNHDKSVIVDISAGSEWKTIEVPFVAQQSMKTGDASICFSFGALSQKVEISGLQLLNFEKKIPISKLPVTRFTYKGRDINATWRQDALKRIEDIRTAPLQIKVIGKDNNPISGLDVKVSLIQSDFLWGTAIKEDLIANDLPDSKEYKSVLKEFFNTAVIENGFKAATWTGKPELRNETLKAFDWLEKNGFRQRGHNLIWPAWKFNSKSLKELALKDTTAFRKFLDKEITEKVSLLKGRVIAWDVVNELIHERDFFEYLPKNTPVKWYELAKKLDPNAQLFMNEYGMLNSIASPRFIKEYLDTIAQLKENGAPIDAIGIQGHVGRQPRDPLSVLTDLDMFKSLGLPVQITEFDINMTDEELQADYTRDFLIACYSHPVVTGFINWGFWQEAHWKPDAAMYRKDWSIKPNGIEWRKLVVDEWNTKFKDRTNSDGIIKGKGHLGLYEIVVTDGKTTVKAIYHLTKENQSFIIQF